MQSQCQADRSRGGVPGFSLWHICTLQFSEIGTAGAFHKLKSDADNFGYEIGTFKPSSLDPHAAHGARLIHDYLRMNDTGSNDGTSGGLAELIRTGLLGMTI